jgi:PAS domain S-box-containing protein
MTRLTSKIFSSSEYDRLQNLVKHPKEDPQEIIGLLERKVEAEYKKCKESETELKKTEQRFRSLIEQTTDAVFCYEYNPPIPINLPIDEQVKRLYEGFLVDCNLVCARSYGASQVEDVIGRKLTDLFGTAPNSLDKLFRDLIEGEYSIIDGVGIEKLSNGEERYFLNNGHSVIENNKLTRVWGTFRDITDRKKAEETLYHEQDLIHTLLDNHPDFIYFKDSNARFQHISKRFCDLFGRTVEDIIGKTDLELFPEEVAVQTHSEDLQIIKTGIPLINKEETDGETWVLSTKMPWLDNEGNIKGVFGISRDITDLKKTEQLLKESEEKYRLIFDNSPIGIGISNKAGEVITINKKMHELTKFTLEELNKFGLRATYDPKDRIKLLKMMDETGIVKDYELKLKRADGTHYIGLMNINMIDLGGEMLLHTAMMDVTERINAEIKLKESEEKYRILVEQSLQGIIIIQDIKIVFANSAMAEILGYSVEELLRFSTEELVNIIHPEDRTFVLNRHKDRMEGKTVPNQYEYRIIRKDNEIRTIEFYATVMEYEGKIASQQVFIDITERKEAERKLKESEE